MNMLKLGALLCMMLLVFSVPTDGIVMIAGMSIVKVTGLLSFGLITIMILAGVPLKGDPLFYLAIVLYIGWVVLSFLWTAMPVDYETTQAVSSWQAIKANLYALMLAILVFQLVDTEVDLHWIAAAFVAGSGVLALILLRNYDPTIVRNQVALFDSNEVSVKLAMAIPVAVYVFTHIRQWWVRLGAFIYIPIAMLAIASTGSRTGGVIMIISLLAFIPLFIHARGITKLITVIAAIAVSIFILNLIPKATVNRMLSVGSEISQGTLNERSVIWRNAYQEWQAHPVAGQGIGSFRRIVNRYNTSYTAHNSYIAIAVEQGLVGVCLYIGVILTAIFYAFKLRWELSLISLALLFVVILGQMSLTLQDRMHIWWAYVFPVVLFHMQQRNGMAPQAFR